MADKRTITIKSISGSPWNKPDSDQYWYTVVINEYPSEPIKFIQDKSKGAPEPVVGESFTGNIYSDAKGMKFYAFGENRPAPTSATKPDEAYWQDKQAQIRAQWAINQSREYIQHMLGEGAKLTEILDTAKIFYEMVDQVKASTESVEQSDSASGYDKFQEAGSKLNSQEEKAENEEIKSLLDTEHGIDLSDIPF